MRPLFIALGFSLAAGPLSGQRLAQPFDRWQPILQAVARSDTVPKTPVPDYRWEGMAVGGALVGVLGAALGGGLCGYDDVAPKANCTWPTIEGFLVGAVVGGVTGGLLGSLINKPPPASPDHP